MLKTEDWAKYWLKGNRKIVQPNFYLSKGDINMEIYFYDKLKWT